MERLVAVVQLGFLLWAGSEGGVWSRGMTRLDFSVLVWFQAYRLVVRQSHTVHSVPLSISRTPTGTLHMSSSQYYWLCFLCFPYFPGTVSSLPVCAESLHLFTQGPNPLPSASHQFPLLVCESVSVVFISLFRCHIKVKSSSIWLRFPRISDGWSQSNGEERILEVTFNPFVSEGIGNQNLNPGSAAIPWVVVAGGWGGAGRRGPRSQSSGNQQSLESILFFSECQDLGSLYPWVLCARREKRTDSIYFARNVSLRGEYISVPKITFGIYLSI